MRQEFNSYDSENQKQLPTASMFQFYIGCFKVMLNYAWVLFGVCSSNSTTGEARNLDVYWWSSLSKHIYSVITNQDSVNIPIQLLPIKAW